MGEGAAEREALGRFAEVLPKRAYKWREWVLAGEVPNRIAEAKRLDLNEEYFRRSLEFAFIAPEIVEAILDGRHPPDLNVKKLSRRRLPLNWIEQRTQLGLPSR